LPSREHGENSQNPLAGTRSGQVRPGWSRLEDGRIPRKDREERRSFAAPHEDDQRAPFRPASITLDEQDLVHGQFECFWKVDVVACESAPSIADCDGSRYAGYALHGGLELASFQWRSESETVNAEKPGCSIEKRRRPQGPEHAALDVCSKMIVL